VLDNVTAMWFQHPCVLRLNEDNLSPVNFNIMLSHIEVEFAICSPFGCSTVLLLQIHYFSTTTS